MNLAWQNTIVIALVVMATAYVVRQAWLVFAKRKSGCGSGCNSCSANEEDTGANRAKPFISSDELSSTFENHSTK